MQLPFKRAGQVHAIITLRFYTIALQLVLIAFVNVGLHYDLPWLPLLSILLFEVIFTLVSFFHYKKPYKSKKSSHTLSTENFTPHSSENIALSVQICADVIFLSLLLYFSGGATNAFVSLLLIPIAIAAVTLPSVLIIVVAGLAIVIYSVLLWLMPMSVMHGNMEGHFIGMWINFLFSACVVALVVGKMARTINEREMALAAYRENLLQQEKIISLGVASAQVTHQLATPIATIQLLADELIEDEPENAIILDMQKELYRCKESLNEFRELSFETKKNEVSSKPCQLLVQEMIDYMSLNNPDIQFDIRSMDDVNNGLEKAEVLVDISLMPAILNLINNAVRATKANGSNQIQLTNQIVEQSWQMTIRDYGLGFKQSTLNELGVNTVQSDNGLGMAVFLSHASLERLGGKLVLTNHNDGGALVTVSLPLRNVQ